MSLVVERVQYGVGQGAFHTQSITIDRDCFWQSDLQFPQDGLRFDFVFDCGTKGSRVADALADSIKHYRPKASLANHTATESIDALFISHFHDDHINGISQLCKAKKVERIFAPFHTQEDVLAVVLRSSEWLESANIPMAQVAVFLTELGHLYRRERLFGLPTIYVVPPDLVDDIRLPESLTDPALPVFPDGVQVTGSVNQRALFTDSDALRFGPIDGYPKIWEIKTWHFRLNHPTPSVEWQQAIDDLKKELSSTLGKHSVIDETTAKELLKKAGTIRKTLYDALDFDQVKHAKNHNLVSLCVYSGPPIRSRYPNESAIQRMNGPSIGSLKTDFHLDFSLHSPKLGRLQGGCHAEGQHSERTGWLGTGDALLGEDTVWQDFSRRLEWRRRSERVATVQIPHHGSAHGSNGAYYNPELLRHPDTLAVISAGAFSSYGHPALAVLSDMLQLGNPVVHIHEFVRPGLIEVVKVDY